MSENTENRDFRLPAKMLTLDQVEEVLNLKRATTLKIIGRGELPAYKIGGSWRVAIDDLEQYIVEARHEGRSGTGWSFNAEGAA